MVERSEPLVVTPHACPFVALDGDRDRRRDAPDALHRCFADEPPKARSMGHQAGYCLSPGFTGCPIFLDWASRVAADVVEAPLVGAAVGAETPVAAAAAASGTVAPAAAASRTESVQRPWAAAPPWVAEAMPPGDPMDISRRTAIVDIDTGVDPAMAPPVTAAAAAPFVAPLVATPGEGVDGPAPATDATRTVAPAYQPSPFDDDGAAAELAASMARTDLLAGTAVDVGVDGAEGASGAPSDGSPETPPWSRGRPRVPVDAGAPSSLAPQTRPGARPAGPREWEGARRFEAYAARTGSRRPGRPVLVAIGAMLVAVALLVVFLLPSLFAGGTVQATPTPDPAASGFIATERPGATPAKPRVTPQRPDATPRDYRVKSGDTLSRIARRFNLTVEQLQCANDIRNPNSVRVGTTLTIPVESYRCPQPTKKPKKTPGG